MTRLVLFRTKYNVVTKDNENKDEDTFLSSVDTVGKQLDSFPLGQQRLLCWQKIYKHHSENASGEKKPPAPESKSTASLFFFFAQQFKQAKQKR